VYYNAGTDILEGDPLGQLDITKKGKWRGCGGTDPSEGVVQRDELVFRYAMGRGVPLVMLLSGGYQRTNATVIATSITNLFRSFPLRTPTQQVKEEKWKG
jgi:histone deacetylase 11